MKLKRRFQIKKKLKANNRNQLQIDEMKPKPAFLSALFSTGKLGGGRGRQSARAAPPASYEYSPASKKTLLLLPKEIELKELEMNTAL